MHVTGTRRIKRDDGSASLAGQGAQFDELSFNMANNMRYVTTSSPNPVIT